MNLSLALDNVGKEIQEWALANQRRSRELTDFKIIQVLRFRSEFTKFTKIIRLGFQDWNSSTS